MAKYVFAYTGGSRPTTEEEQQQTMAAWGAWMGGLGAALLDAGNPFGPSASVGAHGDVGGAGPSGLSGYSIVAADSLAAATGLARGCPVLASGGAVEVYETIEVM